MAVEHGIVTEVHTDTAVVKTTRTSSCEGCASRGSCMSEGSSEMMVEAINTAGARVGDHVVVSVQTGSFLKVTFLLYMFPVLCLMTGAGIGHFGAAAMGLNASGAALVLGFGAFLAAIGVMIRKAGQMAKSEAYRPKIVRITRHPPAGLPGACEPGS